MVLHFPANIKSQDGAACCVLRCVIFLFYLFTLKILHHYTKIVCDADK